MTTSWKPSLSTNVHANSYDFFIVVFFCAKISAENDTNMTTEKMRA